MKQVIRKKLVVAGLAMITVPATLLAQSADERKAARKESMQTITIIRTGEKDEKMTIEVDGDKVKVNGKDAKDNKDVQVHVSDINAGRIYHSSGPGNSWTFNNDMAIFGEDSNRPMLGVNTDEDEKGAKVTNITEGSAAEKAGVKKGDIITKVGDKKIVTGEDLTKAIRAQKVGDKVAITVLRDGKEQKLNAELTKWKGLNMAIAGSPRADVLMDRFKELAPLEAPRTVQGFYYSGRPKLGLSIEDTDEGNGVKVLEVDEESNAAKAGIKKDDIILSIDEEVVKATDDVMRVIRRDKEKYNFNFKVQRAGKTQNIEVKFPKKLKKAEL